jgi:RNA polymerase sigma factor (sigma-70 family)
MAKEYFVVINGEKVAVSEEVYRAFKRPLWSERKRRKVRAEHERSLDAFIDDGFDIPDGGRLISEILEDKQTLELLFAALEALTADERELIDALFFDDKSEQELANETGVSQQAVSKRKNRILAKLKKLLG